MGLPRTDEKYEKLPFPGDA